VDGLYLIDKVRNNISETAGSNISIDAAKNISEKAGDSKMSMQQKVSLKQQEQI